MGIYIYTQSHIISAYIFLTDFNSIFSFCLLTIFAETNLLSCNFCFFVQNQFIKTASDVFESQLEGGQYRTCFYCASV